MRHELQRVQPRKFVPIDSAVDDVGEVCAHPGGGEVGAQELVVRGLVGDVIRTECQRAAPATAPASAVVVQLYRTDHSSKLS